MGEPELKSSWSHRTGAKAWMNEVEGMLHGQPVRQANLHVEVPEEHRKKGIAKDLLGQAVRELEDYNREQPDQSKRFHNAFVTLALGVGNVEAAKRAFESAGFSVSHPGGNDIYLKKELANYW